MMPYLLYKGLPQNTSFHCVNIVGYCSLTGLHRPVAYTGPPVVYLALTNTSRDYLLINYDQRLFVLQYHTA